MATALDERLINGRTDQGPRSAAPVFIVGCPRSGTTVLYHMLLSSGGFAVYRAESHAFNLLGHCFGSLKTESNRKALLKEWLRSKMFRVSGLDAEQLGRQVISEARSEGDFLRIYMREIARAQGVDRWADTTPDHLLYMREIKRQIPDALFIHIIRDGRDVALSFARQGWAHPLPWDHGRELGVAALYWAWVVGRGRRAGRELGGNYFEVRFEDLVGAPREVLARVGEFINHDLDYERIQSAGIGSVTRPNTSFADANGGFNPVDRWRTRLGPEQSQFLESLIGPLLKELGYPPPGEGDRPPAFPPRIMRALYPQLFSAKFWLKNHTLLGRFADTSLLEIQSE
jgi:hypothetical protein